MDIIYAPIAGALVGFVVGLTGIGGGALMAPILLTVFNVEIQAVIATDLLYATITKLFSAGFHTAKKRVNWQISRFLWLGSIPLTLLLVLCVYLLGTASLNWIKPFLGCMILFSGLSWLITKISETEIVKKKNKITPSQKIKTSLSGACIGIVTTLTSVGAGSFGAFVLKLIYPKSLSVKSLIATETIHAIPISFIAGMGLLFMGKTDLKLLVYLLLGSLPAAFLASLFMEKVSGDVIKKVLGVILIIVSLKLIFDF